jgi:phosphoribosyl 1,2-cyclic phosphate phosphodiesterase
MKIRLLGTGAADGIPALFGDDRVSAFAREHGGKDVRTRTAAIIDDHIKIDLPPDTHAQLLRDHLEAKDWTALIFTHSDDDHCSIDEIQYALSPFTKLDYLQFPIYANDIVGDMVRGRYPDWPMEIVETRSFECYEHMGYRITPVRATHIPGEDCHNLLVQKDGKTLLYATDTGIWNDDTWSFLSPFKLDLLIIECTDGFDPTMYEGHLDIEECKHVVDRLRKASILKPDSKVVTTHHSVRGLATHSELEIALNPHGIEVGYDGLVLEA